MFLLRKSAVVVYVRHAGTCLHREDESYPRCDCPKWIRWSRAGKQVRQPAGTRTWGVAEEKAREQQRSLDAGKSVTPVDNTPARTIEACIQTFITGKEGEGTGHSTLRKLRYQLACFEKFMSTRSKLFPSEITPTDVIEYCASWLSWSDLTRIKAQQNLRGFLRFACGRDNRDDVLSALKTIKETKAGIERREPKPFTEAELEKLLAQVPVTFPDTVKAARVTGHRFDSLYGLYGPRNTRHRPT